jgi:hypothetical protein
MISSYPHINQERVEMRSSSAILAAGLRGQTQNHIAVTIYVGLLTNTNNKQKERRSDIIKVNRADHPSKDETSTAVLYIVWPGLTLVCA